MTHELSNEERWLHAVKHLQDAAKLLDCKLTESFISDNSGTDLRRLSLTFDLNVLFPEVEETKQEGG